MKSSGNFTAKHPRSSHHWFVRQPTIFTSPFKKKHIVSIGPQQQASFTSRIRGLMVYCRYYSSYFHNMEYTHQNPRLLCDYSQIALNLGCPCWWEENVIEGCFSALLANPTSNVYQNFPQCQLANCFAKFWKAYPHF